MRIDVFTIFPDPLDEFLRTGVVGRARESGPLDLRVHDIRAGAEDARRSVDDAPFGGGAGMVLMPAPVFAAVESVERAGGLPRPLLLLSPAGERFTQEVARRLAQLPHGFSLICGRYEGVDQRIADNLADGELSIGDFVLPGGESAAAVVVEAVTRLVPGVLGNAVSTEEESFADGGLEYPHYTRPAVFRGWAVPDVLLSGDHGAVTEWRRREARQRTAERRPDLLAPDRVAADVGHFQVDGDACDPVGQGEVPDGG